MRVHSSHHAAVVELVYTAVLETVALGIGGSTPSSGTDDAIRGSFIGKSNCLINNKMLVQVQPCPPSL